MCVCTRTTAVCSVFGVRSISSVVCLHWIGGMGRTHAITSKLCEGLPAGLTNISLGPAAPVSLPQPQEARSGWGRFEGARCASTTYIHRQRERVREREREGGGGSIYSVLSLIARLKTSHTHAQALDSFLNNLRLTLPLPDMLLPSPRPGQTPPRVMMSSARTLL